MLTRQKLLAEMAVSEQREERTYTELTQSLYRDIQEPSELFTMMHLGKRVVSPISPLRSSSLTPASSALSVTASRQPSAR